MLGTYLGHTLFSQAAVICLWGSSVTGGSGQGERTGFGKGDGGAWGGGEQRGTTPVPPVSGSPVLCQVEARPPRALSMMRGEEGNKAGRKGLLPTGKPN